MSESPHAAEHVVLAASVLVLAYAFVQLLRYAYSALSVFCRVVSAAATVALKLACLGVVAALLWLLVVPTELRHSVEVHVGAAWAEPERVVALARAASAHFAAWRRQWHWTALLNQTQFTAQTDT